MRKTILMGTREDVINRRSKQSATAPVYSGSNNRTPIPVRRIVTFNHPVLVDSLKGVLFFISGLFKYVYNLEKLNVK